MKRVRGLALHGSRLVANETLLVEEKSYHTYFSSIFTTCFSTPPRERRWIIN